jgi:hypothetical protein
LYNQREYSKFVYLYSTLNPIEIRMFPYNSLAKKSIKKVNSFKTIISAYLLKDISFKKKRILRVIKTLILAILVVFFVK